MRIGFDAKRAFFNLSGLGNYSRYVIRSLSKYQKKHEYFLYVPKKNPLINVKLKTNQTLHYPGNLIHQKLHPIWRTYLLSDRLKKDHITVFHGLSNELPLGIHRKKIASIVTIHDLIFIQYPQWYPTIDRNIYQKKTKYSSQVADRIIAISEQTKSDLIEFYRVDPEKIDVIYQGCHPRFSKHYKKKYLKKIIAEYNLPSNYMLYVGTIEERKNLLGIICAIEIGSIDLPLVVVGKTTQYAHKVKKYIADKGIKNIYFLENVPNKDLPALYQRATLFIYPSLFEGFGLPILEALNSGTPVITSKGGCFKEAGGKNTIYIDPGNIEELSDAIEMVLTDSSLREKMIDKGYKHAEKFNDQKIAGELISTYKKVIS